MIRSIRAELIKLTRVRLVAVTAAVIAAFAIVGTIVGISSAESVAPGAPPAADRLLSVEALSEAGGGTAVFAQTAGLAAAFLLAAFIGTVAAEFSRGTFRTMLLQQPGRVRVLVGKMTALVGFAAVVALFAEVISWVTARVIAPGQGIDASQWATVDGLGAAVEDFGRLLVYLVGYAVLATMIGVLARSVPLGVGIGLVWAGPIENVIGDGWAPGEELFPGLLLRAIINPGSTGVSTGQAVATMAVYSALAIGIAGVALHRRDVTS